MAKKILVRYPEGHEKAGKLTGEIQFTFEGQEPVSIDVNQLNDEMKFNRLVHGVSQTVGDSHAGAGKEPNPNAAARQFAKETVEQLLAGVLRASSGGGPRITDLATAYAQVSGETIEAAVELVEGLNDDEAKALRAKPRIKAALLSIAAKRAAEKAAAAVAAAEAEEAKNPA